MSLQSFYFEEIKTTIGKIFILENKKGICSVLPCKDPRAKKIKRISNLTKGLVYHKKIIKNLNHYLDQKESLLKFPTVFLWGTAFQINVWKELQKIPYGVKSDYSTIAKKIQITSAARAVGTAIGKNPIMIYVPCHRVIKKSGDLGGYAWGIQKKKLLLHIEATKKDG